LPVGAVVDEPRRLSVAEVRRDPRLLAILLEHAFRGVRVQQLLRAVLVVFVTVTVIAVPPAHFRTGCYVTVALYAASAVGIGWVSLRGGERAIRLVWLALFVDLLALGVLSVLASQSEQSWTADVLVNGFFVVPLLAGTQLRPGVAAAVAAPAVAIYLGSLIAAQNANAEPSASIVLRTVVLAGLSVACVLLSSIQRSRVLTIAALADDRTRLLGELVDVESRARGMLAEELHDGALQYLLAARQDIDDARRGDATSLDRVEFALRESAALLRAKVSQLHPAVLEQAGLLHALRELVRTTAERSELDIELVAEGLDDESARSSADYLLYSAARELLTNVTKHAHAHAVKIALQRSDGHIRLTVSDDGTGIDERVLEQRLAEGHVGVSSQRVRVMAAGGSFQLRRGERGTIGEVQLPLERR
jgi:two-component system NarL family sensor kinase